MTIIFETPDGDPSGVASQEEVAEMGIMLALSVFRHSDDLSQINEVLANIQHITGASYPAVVTAALQWGATQLYEPVLQARGSDFAAYMRAELLRQIDAKNDEIQASEFGD